RPFDELREGAAGALVLAAARGRLDELDQAPRVRPERVAVARALGSLECGLVPSRAVVDERAGVVEERGNEAADSVLLLVDPRERSAFLETAGVEPRRVPCWFHPRHIGDRLRFGEGRRGGVEITRCNLHVGPGTESMRKRGERAGVTSQPNGSASDRLPVVQ